MTRWTSLHLHLATGATSAQDRVVTDVVVPTVAATGHPWFFIRYWQRGPHVRLRVADLDEAGVSALTARLESLLAVHATPRADEPLLDAAAYLEDAARHASSETGENRRVASMLPPGVHPARYDPEVERYGGAAVLAASEELFVRSSSLVAGLLPGLTTPAARRRAALVLTQVAAGVLGPVPDQAVFYEVGRRSWAAMGAAYGVDGPVLAAAATARTGPDAAAFASCRGPAAAWRDAVAELLDALSAAGVDLPGRVLASHVHMTHNRLGLGVLDELRTYAALARAFPADAGAVPDLGLPVPA